MDEIKRSAVGIALNTQKFGRRSFLLTAGALPLLLAGCSDGTDSSTVDADAGAFPVTVNHAFGTTMVETPPKRVVVLSAMEGDLCVGLGLAPLGLPRIADTPWFQRELGGIQMGEKPVHLDDRSGIPLDDIADLKPDLILAMSAELGPDEFGELSALAPVIPRREPETVDGWRELASIAARCLGREKALSEFIEKTEEVIRVAVEDYPGLHEASAAYLEASTVQGADIVIHAPASVPMQVMREFGLVDAPALKHLVDGFQSAGRKSASYVLPRERAHEVSADVLIVAVSSTELSVFRQRGELPELPTFGAESVHFISEADAIAMQTGSPLAFAWIARNLVPEFAKLAYLSERDQKQ